MSRIIEDLNWRYATKKFDSTKKVSSEDLNIIKEALRLTPTSLGLMPLKFFIIENPELREKLKGASNGQTQVTDASHLIVLCSIIDTNDTHVDDHIALMSSLRNVESSTYDGFGKYAKSYLTTYSVEMKQNWNSKQAYIALGVLMSTCAQLRIDATPMEGFSPEGYDEILNLKAQNLHAALVCPIGYRHEDDKYQYLQKVRKHHDDLFETL